MSTRPFSKPYSVITNGDMSGDLVSKVTNIQQISHVSYDIAWTGDSQGTFSVEVSNSYTQDGEGAEQVAGNWTTLTLSTPVTASGTDANAFIDIDDISAVWIRLRYTKAAGTSGILNVIYAGKVA